ncbi:unnamed protein product [Mytilus edulis]|uniref:Uncharacterized protein n=1 Tax=Mytilus edulis TaxID=6550 RepID=A0A8S3SZN8_MYTED|nr:unnamed protein product [Mytilus edulis]
MSKFKKEVKKDIECVQKELSSMRTSYAEVPKQPIERQNIDDQRNNIIIRNLQESDNENITNKVNGLLKDGLRLKDIRIKSVDRKKSMRENKPGVIIVKLERTEDKRRVMEVKRNLKDTRNFRDVFIDHDLPKSQRMLNANLRHIVKTIGNDKLEIHGSRIQLKKFSDNRHDNSNTNERNNGYINTRYDNDNRDNRANGRKDYNRRNNDWNRDQRHSNERNVSNSTRSYR